MASTSPTSLLLLLLAVAVVLSDAQLQLSETFYDATCPQAAYIVQQKGCDGSVLLNSTDTMLTEKEALLNKGSLRGFEQIDEIKMELECACPGVVSCADILALVARDATAKVGGTSWPVFLGRIDGVASFADQVNSSLPERTDNFTQLVARRTLYWTSSLRRIFRAPLIFQGLNITDPSMDPEFAAMLKVQCPPTKPFGFMALDATNGTFGSAYYLDLLTNKGLLESDVALLSDPLGVEYAIELLTNKGLVDSDVALRVLLGPAGVGRDVLEQPAGRGMCRQSDARPLGFLDRVSI
ncbi:hypothetical protein AXG93_412s1130 [Marchantia polymorpha subsp. ruderalis]|uniref:Peroxidase n=1 Tax=Marchantia polymorpha subsp. ruderalis TaxID=1480154 RepID=A0A176VMU0_MARPO|nr:hypothetical protein AXG93_412s1130 [Marchantia polymorpha subsp. ruderalis]